MSLGEAGERQHFGLASSINGPTFGNELARWSRTSFHALLMASGSGRAKTLRKRGDQPTRDLGMWVSRLRAKRTRHLMSGTLKGSLQRRHRSGVLIGDDQTHSGQADQASDQ